MQRAATMKLAVLALSLTSTLALAGRAAAAPSWCAGTGGGRVDRHGGLEDALTNQDPRNALPRLVARTCSPEPEDRERMRDLDAARKRWSEKLELTEADWSDVAAYATLDQGRRMSGEVSLALREGESFEDAEKRPWSSLDAIDQYVVLNTKRGASGALSLDHNYLADALGAKLTETGRLGYVRDCLRTRENPVQWAMCQGDVERLDAKKIAAELRANAVYDGGSKIIIRIELAELAPKLGEHAARIKALAGKDPAYGKIFELAAATRKDWDGRVASDAALLALVAEMDDGRVTRSRKAFADCDARTWSAWKAAVATVPAKKYEGLKDDRANGKSFLDGAFAPILGNPEAYLASVAMVTCWQEGQTEDSKRDVLVRNLGDALARWPGYRGARTATETAVYSAGLEFDDRDTKLEYPQVDRPFASNSYTTGGGGAGVVAKMEAKGDRVTVTFKKQLVKQVQCAQARQTNRVTMIRPDGSLIYETVCVRNETVIVDKADDPQTVKARYVDGLKPGMFVTCTEDVAVAAWAQPGAATPTMVFGVALK